MFYRRSFVGPAVLILIGVVFLGINFGWLDRDIWRQLWRLWPVLLILLGLELLLVRPSRVEGVAIAHPLGGAARAAVDLRFQVGRLRVLAADRADMLVDGTAAVGAHDRITHRLRREGDAATFELRDEAVPVFPFAGRWGMERFLQLGLSPAVPLRLQVRTGVGAAELDLSRLQLTDLDLHSGVGETTVTLAGRGQYAARVEGGVGEVRVGIPRGMAARIRVRTGIGATRVTGPYHREHDVYTSPGYAEAPDRVDLDLRGGIGQITVREV